MCIRDRNVPPADLINWKEFLAHGIESFGEHLVDELGRVNLSATPTPIQAEEGSVSLMSSGESTRLDTVGNTVDLEAELVSIRGATNLFSQNFYELHAAEDGMTVTFPSDVDLGVQVLINHLSLTHGSATLSVKLQARINSSASWEDIKSGDVAIHGTVATGTLSSDSDVSFVMGSHNRFYLRWVVEVTENGLFSTLSSGNVTIRVRTQDNHYLTFTIKRRAESQFSVANLTNQTGPTTQVVKAGINDIDGIATSVLDFTSLDRNLVAGEDLPITFHSGDDVTANWGASFSVAADYVLKLQGKKTTDTNWTDIKSGSGSVATGVHDTIVTMTNSSDVTFELADTESLEFQWELELTNAGSFIASTILLQTGTRLVYSINSAAIEAIANISEFAGIAEVLATLDSEGRIESSVDGLSIVVPSDTGLPA